MHCEWLALPSCCANASTFSKANGEIPEFGVNTKLINSMPNAAVMIPVRMNFFFFVMIFFYLILRGKHREYFYLCPGEYIPLYSSKMLNFVFMKKIGFISLLLLLLTLVIQIVLVVQLRKATIEKVHKVATLALGEATERFLDGDLAKGGFTCGMSDDTTFHWKGRTAFISSIADFHTRMLDVTYDHLFENQMLDCNRLDSIYRQELLKHEIEATPVLVLKDKEGSVLYPEGKLQIPGHAIWTEPVQVGYDCQHKLVAALSPLIILQQLKWNLILAGLFFLSFVGCLYWQLSETMGSVRKGKIQAEGVAHIEHELGKPLNGILMVVQDLAERQDGAWTAGDREQMGLVNNRLCHIRNLSETMLYALKQGNLPIRREEVDVRHELQQAIEMEKKPSVKINCRVAEGIEKARLDKVFFRAVVANLLNNGIKYNKSMAPEVNVDFSREGNWGVLKVTDNGIGIPKRKLKRIFKCFYRVSDQRTKDKTGFGIGLTFIKRVVDAYGGTIKVESAENQGTMFVLKFPVYNEA